ncbi:MAG: hypothetical protein ACE15F_10070 [bacterium]
MGKKKLVIGLLCGEKGDPVSTEVITGNTSAGLCDPGVAAGARLDRETPGERLAQGRCTGPDDHLGAGRSGVC